MAITGVSERPGVLSTENKGKYEATGGTGERIIVDYKDTLQDYKVTDLPALQMFTESMSTDTGGDIDLTFSLPSMKLEQIDEGSTPKYQNSKMRSERVSVKEWGIAVGVTRRMIEDSRFNEVELALNEARRAVDRHLTDHVVKAIFGIGDTVFGTGVNGSSITKDTAEAGTSSVSDFDANVHGGFIASGGTVNSGRLYSYANADDDDLTSTHYTAGGSSTAGTIKLADITSGIDLIGTHGFTADTLVISPAHYKSLLDLADFQVALTAGHVGEEAEPFKNTLGTGMVGSLYGLRVVVNAWIPSSRFGIFDLSSKPAVYLQRRPLTVEEANPGFGIIGSYLSMRYGLKVVRPETGVIVIH